MDEVEAEDMTFWDATLVLLKTHTCRGQYGPQLC
jgi:hypothetical protein